MLCKFPTQEHGAKVWCVSHKCHAKYQTILGWMSMPLISVTTWFLAFIWSRPWEILNQVQQCMKNKVYMLYTVFAGHIQWFWRIFQHVRVSFQIFHYSLFKVLPPGNENKKQIKLASVLQEVFIYWSWTFWSCYTHSQHLTRTMKTRYQITASSFPKIGRCWLWIGTWYGTEEHMIATSWILMLKSIKWHIHINPRLHNSDSVASVNMENSKVYLPWSKFAVFSQLWSIAPLAITVDIVGVEVLLQIPLYF